MKTNKRKKLGITQMVKHFAEDMVTLAEKGLNPCSKEEYQERLEECGACEHMFIDETFKIMRCGMCGCPCKSRARSKSWTCPDGRWRKLKIDERRNTKDSDGEGSSTAEG